MRVQEEEQCRLNEVRAFTLDSSGPTLLARAEQVLRGLLTSENIVVRGTNLMLESRGGMSEVESLL